MTEAQPSKHRAPTLPGLLAFALAVVAITTALLGVILDISSLGLIAAAIAAVLAAVVVWLNGTQVATNAELAAAERQLLRHEAAATPSAVAEEVTERIIGTAEHTTIRTPAGDLTGLLGERYFVVTLEARVAAARRHLRPLALVLVEAVQEAAGAANPIDATIAAEVIRETLRDADTLCRLQNGRYAVLLEDTPENGAIWTVERIRRRLGEQLEDVTVWAGIACYPANGFDGPEVLDRARDALEQAREWRQDRTEVADT